MAKRQNLEAVSGAEGSDTPSHLKKINRDLLAKIKLARQEALNHANEAATHQLKAQSAENAMRLIVAEALMKLGLPINGNIVCLNCGSVRAETQPPQPCPGCGAP